MRAANTTRTLGPQDPQYIIINIIIISLLDEFLKTFMYDMSYMYTHGFIR